MRENSVLIFWYLFLFIILFISAVHISTHSLTEWNASIGSYIFLSVLLCLAQSFFVPITSHLVVSAVSVLSFFAKLMSNSCNIFQLYRLHEVESKHRHTHTHTHPTWLFVVHTRPKRIDINRNNIALRIINAKYNNWNTTRWMHFMVVIWNSYHELQLPLSFLLAVVGSVGNNAA